MYERVLLPTDGSNGALVATEHALELAEYVGAPLHALYVVDTTAGHASDAYAGVAVDALQQQGEEEIERVRQLAEEQGIDATTQVVTGAPPSSIVEASEPGDVIVMGTHGRTGLSRYLIGSTTEKVVRTADVPVVTVPLPKEEEDEPAE